MVVGWPVGRSEVGRMALISSTPSLTRLSLPHSKYRRHPTTHPVLRAGGEGGCTAAGYNVKCFECKLHIAYVWLKTKDRPYCGGSANRVSNALFLSSNDHETDEAVCIKHYNATNGTRIGMDKAPCPQTDPLYACTAPEPEEGATGAGDDVLAGAGASGGSGASGAGAGDDDGGLPPDEAAVVAKAAAAAAATAAAAAAAAGGKPA